jgi:hypothetical protein
MFYVLTIDLQTFPSKLFVNLRTALGHSILPILCLELIQRFLEKVVYAWLTPRLILTIPLKS